MKKAYYVWLREIKRYLRSKPRIVGSLGMPLLFLFALGFGLNNLLNIEGTNYVEFILPGIIAMTVLMNSMMSGVSVIWDKQFGFMREMLVTPISRIELIIGKALGGGTTAVLQGILVLIISLFLGIRIHSAAGILVALGFMIIIGITFSALGLCFASFIDDLEAFPLIMNFVIMPLFFLSGALFPIGGEHVPVLLKFVTRLNPLTYGVDAIRQALIGVSGVSLCIDAIVMVALGTIFIALGSYLFKKIQM